MERVTRYRTAENSSAFYPVHGRALKFIKIQLHRLHTVVIQKRIYAKTARASLKFYTAHTLVRILDFTIAFAQQICLKYTRQRAYLLISLNFYFGIFVKYLWNKKRECDDSSIRNVIKKKKKWIRMRAAKEALWTKLSLKSIISALWICLFFLSLYENLYTFVCVSSWIWRILYRLVIWKNILLSAEYNEGTFLFALYRLYTLKPMLTRKSLLCYCIRLWLFSSILYIF